MMLKLIIEIAEEGDAISGFDLGDLTFEGDLGACTSKTNPTLANMVFISVTSLLNELRALLSSPNQREHKFVAADSPFSLWFYKSGPDRVRVECNRVVLTEVSSAELCRSLLLDVGAFWSQYSSRLPPDDAVRNDLESSLTEFKRFVFRLPAT